MILMITIAFGLWRIFSILSLYSIMYPCSIPIFNLPYQIRSNNSYQKEVRDLRNGFKIARSRLWTSDVIFWNWLPWRSRNRERKSGYSSNNANNAKVSVKDMQDTKDMYCICWLKIKESKKPKFDLLVIIYSYVLFNSYVLSIIIMFNNTKEWK